jgi:hypothetical protein
VIADLLQLARFWLCISTYNNLKPYPNLDLNTTAHSECKF